MKEMVYIQHGSENEEENVKKKSATYLKERIMVLSSNPAFYF